MSYGEKRRNHDKSAALWISEKNERANQLKTASTQRGRTWRVKQDRIDV